MCKVQKLYLVSCEIYATTTYFPRQKVGNSLILQFKARIYVPVGYINHKVFFVG